ncbi:preprotein translocase subunit YajC [Actinophytocola sp.]|uniref:preprotein translocase subunit YajC n=1 Tax=Actinophytocola sp. TaxID=1872138 RepID=UPI003D6BE73C
MDLLPLLLMFGLLGLMMYFMSRRQRRAQEQQRQLQDSLAVGDRVMTTSGLYGTVVDVSSDTTIGIEIAPGLETEWLRAAVREKVNPDVEDVEDELVDEVDEEEELVDNEPPPAKDDSADVEDVKQK